jgi:DNA-directed RNA polymerase specialized sigma24 family protein
VRREATSPEALALLDRLGSVTSEIGSTSKHLDELLAERNRMFVDLKALDVTHREIAARAGITEMAVKKAIDKTTRTPV